VLDIPLLAEAPEFFDFVDGVLVVSSDEDTRLARLLARGMSEEDVRSRMALQASDAERRAISTSSPASALTWSPQPARSASCR